MSSVASITSPSIQTFHFTSDRLISAPMDVVFETVLQPVGPLAEMALKLEPWPGGRWYRDLGNNTGHLWGHVQVIKPPKLLEIYGPMMMSYAVAAHLTYRLTEEAGGTRLVLTHQAVGLLKAEHLEGMPKGWGQFLDDAKARSEKK
jgi:uncharacterized protein YndB with AHSA1/START domain